MVRTGLGFLDDRGLEWRVTPDGTVTHIDGKEAPSGTKVQLEVLYWLLEARQGCRYPAV